MDNIAEYQIEISKTGTGAAAAVTDFKAVDAAAAQVNNTLKTGTAAHGAHGEAVNRNRMAYMELGHVARSTADSLALGINPMRILAMEGARVVQAFTSMGIGMGTLVTVGAGVAAVVGGLALVWRSVTIDQQKALEAQKQMVESLRGMPDLLKQISEAGKAGILSGDQQQKLLEMVGAARSQNPGVFKATLGQSQNYSFNAQLPAGYHLSTSQMGIPDAVDIQKVNDELVKTGQLLEVIDEKGKKTYVQNPAIEAVVAQKDLIQRMSLERLDGYAKERAEAKQTYDQEIEKLKQIAELESYIADPQKRAAALKENAGAQASAKSGYNARLDSIETTQITADQKEIAAQYKQTQTEKLEALNKVVAAQKQLQQLEDKITLSNLTGEAKKQKAIEQTTAKMVQEITAIGKAAGLTDEQIKKLTADAQQGQQTTQQSAQQAADGIMTTGQMIDDTAKRFSMGFGSAFVDFLDGTKSAKDAFRDFAVSFLQDTAKMIMQQEVLKIVMAAEHGIMGLAGGGVSMAATGGFFPRYAASGLAGVGEVSSATYFPKFNVVAGEAGREMMTVLAKPRFMNLGGMQAVIGNAGGNRLALTNADDLARRNNGGGTMAAVAAWAARCTSRLITRRKRRRASSARRSPARKCALRKT
jgi:hypothetical protein